MPRIDPAEVSIINECREARVCRKVDLCRYEGACHFVAAYERWEDRQFLERMRRTSARIVWHPGFDSVHGEQLGLFGAAA